LAILKVRRENSLTGRGYLIVAAMTIVVLSTLTVLLAIIVDPYRMYGVAPIRGLTEQKPAAYRNSYFVKDYMLDRMKPHTLLLGNSRVEVGLDPNSPLWPDRDRPVFNAAEAGFDLATATRKLRNALEIAPLRLAVVAVDFPDFLAPFDLAAPGDANSENGCPLADRGGRLGAQPTIQRWRDRIITTLTIDALSDSILTIADQNPASSVTMTDAGFNPLHQYAEAARREGYNALFAQKQADYIAQYSAYPKTDFRVPMRHANFRCLDQIVRMTISRRVPLVIFINPYHYTLLELWHEDGLWPTFEAWKRALVAVVDHAAGNDRWLVIVLDFSGYSRFAMEAIPPPDDRHTAMHWYWESGHYTSALGQQLIARIVGKDDHFGQELSAVTIDQVLRNIADARPGATAALSQ
jgi:hypothetical protein